eukprot:TRINITY_DN55668_c0_g1_i1.p1 TRINITY_DN55668_c0_g1~~TRINITY_DN55668_c0_g1_i1.p1  ORF type:complete len:350 (-),score=75.03 TRINITY_DN55668_c0_g1_i1:30-1013(-)
MSCPLVAYLPDNVLYQQLTVVESLNPLSWKVANLLGKQKDLCIVADDFFHETAATLKTDLHDLYLSVAQDADGQHRFLRLEDVALVLQNKAKAESLTLISEAEVKVLQDRGEATTIFARQAASEVLQPRADSTLSCKAALGERDELCPKKSWLSNYDVIPDVSVGFTQRLILCDEATLTRTLPEERIFEHLKLIVNCHENRAPAAKYKIGSCSSGEKPSIICEAVHGWHSLGADDMNATNDMIQAAIWEKLQQGTVAVHCLAGIHRAACIVACHFLYRHYTLGQTDIPCRPEDIYQRLKAARPAVDPAYLHVLRSYEAHLRKKAGVA